MQDLATYFERFIHNISLGEPQVSRMERAAGGIMEFLRTSYGLQQSQVFMQGSYANQTAIEPVEGGEYDVDIIAVCVDDTTGPTTALNELQRRFESNGNYADRIVLKTPCVRLDYAADAVGHFHVDVVPVRVNGETWSAAPLDAPRRNGQWHETAPAEYTAWCADQGELFIRTVKIMKRWRDFQQSVRGAIKSIVLQVLVAGCMPVGVDDDQARLLQTFERLHGRLVGESQPPVVYNPVLPGENLARSWTQESFDSFKRELAEAVDLSRRAVQAEEEMEAIDTWRELLGEDFPAMSQSELGLKVGDYTHAQSLAEQGWQLGYDARFQVRVEASIRRGKYSQLRRIPEEQLIFAGNQLQFTAVLRAPQSVEVWWQVANTGGHARSRGGLRGDIFRARQLSGKPSPQQHVNWERTSYTGVHLIRAILVRDQTVVATSDWRQVNIYAPKHAFFL